MDHDEFMDFMGYRNMLVEEKIEECMKQVRRGQTEISVDRGDLTDAEVREVERAVKNRVSRGRY
ncbi:MAG: hypothetical protein IJL97_03160 [Lachnospiraceae bacterium]|nr:hypothetical protein [Lachnospiraceae bacterium]